MYFGWPVNKALQYDDRERISELESIKVAEAGGYLLSI